MSRELYWTRARCLTSAAPHKKRKHWHSAEPSAYTSAKRKGWFEDCVRHMDPVPRCCQYDGVSPLVKWTYGKVKGLTEVCNTRRKLQLAYPGAYDAARRNRWLDELLPSSKRATK